MSVCPNCSQPTVPDAAHCAFCGKALSEGTTPPNTFTGSAARDYWLGVLLVVLVAVVWAGILAALLVGHLPHPGSSRSAVPMHMGLALTIFSWSSKGMMGLVPVALTSGILWLVLHLAASRRRPHLVRGVRSGFLVLLVVELGAFAACTASLFASAASNKP